MVKDRFSELCEKAVFKDDPKIIEEFEPFVLRNQKQILHDLDQFAEITGWIRDLQRNILDIEVNIFCEGFGKAGQKLKDNATLCFKIFNSVKRLQSDLNKRRQEDDYNDDEMVNRVRNTQFESIKTAYYGAYWKYNGVVRRYEEKLKSQSIIVRSASNLHQLTRASTSYTLLPGVSYDGHMQRFASLDEACGGTLTAVEVRHRDLLALEQSLVEMRDLFVLFSTLVMEHGSLLNLSQANVQIASQSVAKASEDIKEARMLQLQVGSSSGRFCFCFSQMCIMLGVLAVLSAAAIWIVITKVVF